MSGATENRRSVALLRTSATLFCFALAILFVSGKASAHTTICDIEDAVRFGYGTKVEAIVWVPRREGDNFRDSIDAFFDRSDYSMGGAGLLDAEGTQLDWSQLPQSPTLDVSFNISTRRNSDIATISLSTFSFDCGATEDWRPHWRRFEGHLRASRFNAFIAWRPLFSEPAQMVGGGFAGRPWYMSLRGIVAMLTTPLAILGKQRS